MELRLTILILLPLLLTLAAVYAYAIRPFWKHLTHRLATLDEADAQAAELREQAERELKNDDPQP